MINCLVTSLKRRISCKNACQNLWGLAIFLLLVCMPSVRSSNFSTTGKIQLYILFTCTLTSDLAWCQCWWIGICWVPFSASFFLQVKRKEKITPDTLEFRQLPLTHSRKTCFHVTSNVWASGVKRSSFPAQLWSFTSRHSSKGRWFWSTRKEEIIKKTSHLQRFAELSERT